MFTWVSLALDALVAAGGAYATPATADLMAQAPDAAQIAPGDTRNGRLDTSDDRLDDGRYVEQWHLAGERGTTVRITLRSPDFDTWLAVVGPDGAVDVNDDSPGMGTNSALTITLREPGTYTVQASSYLAGSVGDYVLAVAGPEDDRHGSGQAPSGPALEPGVRIAAELTAAAPTLRTGEHFDAYVYAGTAGERVSISLSSGDFDTYLMLRGPDGFTMDNDDVQQGRLDSGIGATLPADGPYRVLVTSYSAGETGRYTLRLESNGRADTVVDHALAVGTPVMGNLTDADPVRAGGQHFQSWTFVGRAGQTVTIDLGSRDVDTFLVLRTPSGDELTNDDVSRRDTNSRINATLTHDGTYTIVASTYLADVVGEYTLSVAAADIDAIVEEADLDEATAFLAIGSQLDGRLARRDDQLQTGEFYDSLTFQGRAGQAVTLTMESSQFDTYLMLRGPAGLSLDNDDGYSDGSTNSRLEAVLPADGEYTILATSYAPGETGRYTIGLVEGTTLTEGARGRVFAILAGITDYSDAADLPFCAEDAVKLGETLQSTGVLGGGSIVLTDDQVTAVELERAFLQVAQLAGPDDVFLFFYSGHGGFLDNRRELDGRDETIYVNGGHVTDDQVTAWFDSVHARLGIIALDSCFSGGFARDVISAPNRMGIFSSEEDVTSNVAARFQAGGYLSYFLREGLAGAADADPRDGITTVGELTQYLHRQWATHGMVNESTETADAALAYQNLVIDRGAVKVTDVVTYTP